MTNLRKAIGAALALYIVGQANEAAAYKYRTCDDVKVVWEGSMLIFQNTFSMPKGSARESAFLNGISRWNAVRGMNDVLVNFASTGLPWITHGNGANESAVVLATDIGNYAGLTYTLYDSCDIFGDQHIVEADVMVASNNDFTTKPDETSLDGSARSVFLHEFGHALGLRHFESFNLMRAALPLPYVGGWGEHADVLPDDAAGGRFLYPSGNQHVNVFATAQLRWIDSNGIANNTGTGPVYSCTGGGGQITINQTVGNNGTVNLKQTERWYVSTSKTAYDDGFLIGQWNNSTYNANSVVTIERKLTMPPLPVGTYYLFHEVDALKEHAEERESDNVSREALQIKVIFC